MFRRFHISYGIGVLCAAFIVGLALALLIELRLDLPLIVMLVVVVFFCLLRIRCYTFMIIVICGILLGLSRGSLVKSDLESLEVYISQEQYITGVVSQDPERAVNGDIRLVIGSISINDKKYRGKIWVTTRDDIRFTRGDFLGFRHKLNEGFGTYQLSAYNVNVSEYRKTTDLLISLRDKFAEKFKQFVVEPSASLGVGFVIGQKSNLTPELEGQLRIVGLMHIVVASGYNLTILVRFAKRLFEKHSKFLATSSSLFLIVGFVMVSGASPSMVRAAIVTVLSIAVWYYGRRFNPVLLILYVAALTASINPVYVWSDLGWWLSFMAFFGVLVLSPLLLHLKYKSSRPPALVQIVVETISAQIMTLPIILIIFGVFPTTAIVANVLTVPFIPFAMLLTFIAGVVAMILPEQIATLVAIPAEIVLSYFIAITRALSTPEWAQVTISITKEMVVWIYLIIISGVFVMWKRSHYNFRSQSSID